MSKTTACLDVQGAAVGRLRFFRGFVKMRLAIVAHVECEVDDDDDFSPGEPVTAVVPPLIETSAPIAA
ncbi:hypothetical protein [Azospirillum argentinense]|uniref:hypothetical protein n=1 Tax=Azospirillum argentinense TaxID=2970906 RepID=UPI0032DFF524